MQHTAKLFPRQQIRKEVLCKTPLGKDETLATCIEGTAKIVTTKHCKGYIRHSHSTLESILIWREYNCFFVINLYRIYRLFFYNCFFWDEFLTIILDNRKLHQSNKNYTDFPRILLMKEKFH